MFGAELIRRCQSELLLDLVRVGRSLDGDLKTLGSTINLTF
jgi:hypothetical protein